MEPLIQSLSARKFYSTNPPPNTDHSVSSTTSSIHVWSSLLCPLPLRKHLMTIIFYTHVCNIPLSFSPGFHFTPIFATVDQADYARPLSASVNNSFCRKFAIFACTGKQVLRENSSNSVLATNFTFHQHLITFFLCSVRRCRRKKPSFSPLRKEQCSPSEFYFIRLI